MAEAKVLLAVFAHPDDEGTVGGTLAFYASQGVKVYLVCATRGEVGEISDPSLATPETLGQAREQELREACRVLGVQEPLFLGYRDSGMAGASENHAQDSLNQADRDEVVGKLVAIVRRLRPETVLTFDPSGLYGHPDHIATSGHTTEAFFQAGRQESFPELKAARLSPFLPQRLYYVVRPRSIMERMVQEMEKAQVPPERLHNLRRMSMPDELVTTAIDVQHYVEVKRRSREAHRTQNNPRNPFALLPQEVVNGFQRTEYFQRAYPTFNESTREGGLFG